MKEARHENPQADDEGAQKTEDTLFSAMQKLHSGELVDEDELAQLTALMLEKMKPENLGQSLLEMIRVAKDSGNIEMLRFALKNLQRRIHDGSELELDRISDHDLRDFLENHTAIKIYVGTGTLGHRVIIRDGEVFMLYDEVTKGDRYSQNFKNIFGLGEEEVDLRVSYENEHGPTDE